MVAFAYSLASEICFEKGAGLLEFLFIAGVSRTTVKLSWLIYGLTFGLSLGAVLAVIFKMFNHRVIERTPLLLLLVAMLLYMGALVAMCFLISSMMATAQRAGIFTFVILLVAYLAPSWGQLLPNVGYIGNIIVVRILSLLHCSITAQISLAYIINWEQIEVGAQWNALSKSPVDGDRFYGLLECMIHHVIQIVYYMLLSWYLDHVAPSKYGFKLPWYFPLSPSYWGCCGRNRSEAAGELAKTSKADIEPRTDNKTAGIVLRNLTKRYGKKVAVDDLSVDFYKQEITALLGHNGAGKSTTMNMLTGMIGPTSGTGAIDGSDMGTQMQAIRRSLGFCPQYDIIYPELTVEEHMKFYGNLKGIKDSKVKEYSNELFTLMKMTHALKTPAGALSGGMKRKLSITISFLGDPTTVILDEPTSAIDPFSRRAIWDVVLRYREKSTIVISTHYMQEADILGDRIAIINHGVLKCYGTTMYLKAKYGAGFYLNLAHQKFIDAQAVETQLRSYIPCALNKKTATETTFTVPLGAARSERMVEACRYLEEEGPRLGIVSFGISESTMEQVFFNVAADDANDNQANVFNSPNIAANAPDFTDYVTHQGPALFLIQIWGTWVKRAHLTKRSVLGFVFQVLVPLGFTAILVFFNNVIASVASNGQLINVNPWSTSFKHGELFYSASVKQDPFINSWLQYDLGTICMYTKPIGETCSTSKPVLPISTVDNSSAPSCDCRICPPGAAGPIAERVLLNSKDTLINLSGRNISAYLIKSQEINLIGGVENIGQTTYLANLANTDCFDILSLMSLPESFWFNICTALVSNDVDYLNNYNDTDSAKLHQLVSLITQLSSGPSATHTVWGGVASVSQRGATKWETDNKYMRSALINGHSNIMLRSLVSNGADPPLAFGINLSTEEVSMTKTLSKGQQVAGILLGLFSAFALMMPSFSTILVVVNENDAGNKQLQFLMGLSRWAYWVANFIWDCVLYIISVLIVIGFMAIFKDTFNFGFIFYFECALLFGVGMILTTYVLSFVIKTARFAILLVGMVSPVFTMAAMILMLWESESWYSSVDALLSIVPPYFIANCLVTVQVQQFTPNPKPLFDWDVLGKKFVLCSIWSVVMLLLLVGYESGIFRLVCRIRLGGKQSLIGDCRDERDQDVINEENAIHSSNQNENQVLAVKSLVKQYGRNGHVAVKGVTFGVNRGQCFGLLGVNGAGKSTLFKMVTGFEKPTSGDASILNFSIFRSGGAVAKHMSYCPQQDTLFDSMTSEDHLMLYSRIRGIPSSHREDIINKMIGDVGLGSHVGKQSQALSGGNKRKLNFSISLLGYPDVIFLDEMTTGMDPKARRSAWTVLQAAINRGCVAVITSHSMEECESLCNRLVIMVNGQFRCIGGVQYLKDKFGRNYNIKLRLKPTANIGAIQSQIERTIKGAQKVEEHLCYLEMQCPADTLKLSTLLQFIHEVKDRLGIEDFSVSQTTLEHVFVNMVKDQE